MTAQDLAEPNGKSERLRRKEGKRCPPGACRRPQLLTFPGGGDQGGRDF